MLTSGARLTSGPVEPICVIYLIWAPAGRGALERFVASYREHDAGIPHRLLAVFKDFRDESEVEDRRASLDGLAHDETVAEPGLLDLGAYRAVAETVGEPRVCMLNTQSVVLADGWLAALAGELTRPETGLVGATGSWESHLSAAPRPLRPLRRRHFPGFPNPHVRTNAFMLDRELIADLQWPVARRKRHAYVVESGARSLTRQVLDRGLRARVVGRDRRGYDPAEWPASRTFRAGAQENLLVADNRTRQYADAEPSERERLRRMAWGETGTLSPPRAPAPAA